MPDTIRSRTRWLKEIRTLLRVRESRQENWDGANQLLDQHIGHVAPRVADLNVLARSSSLFGGMRRGKSGEGLRSIEQTWRNQDPYSNTKWEK